MQLAEGRYGRATVASCRYNRLPKTLKTKNPQSLYYITLTLQQIRTRYSDGYYQTVHHVHNSSYGHWQADSRVLANEIQENLHIQIRYLYGTERGIILYAYFPRLTLHVHVITHVFLRVKSSAVIITVTIWVMSLAHNLIPVLDQAGRGSLGTVPLYVYTDRWVIFIGAPLHVRFTRLFLHVFLTR